MAGETHDINSGLVHVLKVGSQCVLHLTKTLQNDIVKTLNEDATRQEGSQRLGSQVYTSFSKRAASNENSSCLCLV